MANTIITNFIFDIVLSLLTYLYYVIEIEINAYVNEEKKKKYRYLYDKLIKLVNPNNRYIFFEDNDYTEKLFDKMKHVSRSWEIYKDGQVKTPLADESVIIANKSLLVYSRINDYTHGKSVGNYDLELFKYNFEKGTIKNDVYEAIKSYLSFIKLKVEEDRIKAYFESLLNIASKEYKFRNQASKEDFKKGKKSIPALKKDLIERLNNYTIFNNVDTDNEVEIPVRYSFDNSSIGYLVDSINFYNNEFIKVIIWNICHKIAMEITDRVKYSYDNNEPILQKLNKLRGPYYYICYEKDNLGEKWNLGEKYNIAKNRFKIATVPLYNGAMVVKDYACSLKDIEMEITELKDDEVLKYLERYKNDRMYVVNEFGYEVPYNKKEIIEYIKMNNFTISLKAKIKLKVVNNKGTVFVYVNKNKITNEKRGKK